MCALTLALGAVASPSAAQSIYPPLDAERRAQLRLPLAHDSVWTARLRAAIGHVPPTVRAYGPELRVVWNSGFPYSQNDGPLWAGRGLNVSVTGGVGIAQPYRSVMLRAAFVPTVHYSQNRPFQVVENRTPGRSGYANPFHGPAASLDMPLRFGDRPLLGFDPGRSGVAVEWPRVVIGATTAAEWWGPGLRNALVMSNNAAGFPRWFVRTARPIDTWLGRFHARLTSGTLTQSLFFDSTASENRSVSGVLVELVPAFDSALTLGFARVVYAPIGPYASPFTLTLARSLDAITRWENLSGVGQQRSDQIGAVFARWAFPAAGLAVHGEWARMDLPRFATELLTAPHHSGAWTFGVEWTRELRLDRRLRMQAELTYLEQTRVFPDRPSPDFYSGQGSPHGYTQRGQVIGAAVGPGASSQWLAFDWIASRWRGGAFAGRVRWENDAMYRQPAPNFWDHDVSLLAGSRAGWRTELLDLGLELTVARRYNYLFQNGIARPGGYRTVDVGNVTLALVATPR